MKIVRNICLVIGLALVSSQINGQDKPLAVTSASIMADMIENVVGDVMDVKAIVPVGGDPHIYSPTPADAQTVNKAGIIFVNGLTFEGWINELIANAGTDAKVYTITDGISPLTSEKYENASDPHAWMDVSMAITYIDNIYKACVEFMPDQEDIFKFNRDLYIDQLKELDQFVFEQIQKIPERNRVLITSHDAFQYYGRRYGLKLESILGTSTDADAQTSDITRLTKTIRETGVPAVFIESTVNPKLLKQIAEDNNVVIGGELYSDSIGGKDSPAPTYVDMIRFNTNTIVNALSREKENSSESGNGGVPVNMIILSSLILLAILLFVLFNRR